MGRRNGWLTAEIGRCGGILGSWLSIKGCQFLSLTLTIDSTVFETSTRYQINTTQPVPSIHLCALPAMKFILLLGFVLGLAVALEPSGLEGRARRQRRTTTRPRSFSGSPALRMPTRAANAPSDYEVTVTTATRPQSKEALKRIPAEFMHPAMRQRRESFEILRKMRRQALVSDFFECTNPVRRPLCSILAGVLTSP